MEPYTKSIAPTCLVSDWWLRQYERGHQGFADTDQTGRHGGLMANMPNTFSGNRLPNHAALIREGLNATTPLSATQARSDSPGFIDAAVQYSRVLGSPTRIQGAELYGITPLQNPDPGISSPPAGVVTDVSNRAKRKFLKKAEAYRSSVEAGQDFGEYKETIKGLTHPLQSLRHHVLSYFDSLKKLSRYKRHGIVPIKAVADTYLEWTFGWKPLVSDIAQGFVGLQNRSRFVDRQTIGCSAKATHSASTSNNATVNTAGGILQLSQDSRRYSEYKIKLYGMIRTGAQGGIVSRGTTLQIDLPHFVPTVWDLIPYSFIVDYFVNVGDIITALCTVNQTVVWAGESIVQTDVREFSPPRHVLFYTPAQATLDYSYVRGGHCTVTRKTVTRSIAPLSYFLPQVEFSLPDSSKPWLNIGAIISSRLAAVIPLFR
jgi:hypothetical protein